MTKIVKTSLPKQIADNIESKIKKGIYKVGDKLPTEPVLVQEYGVSRNTLREAIQSLTNSGLLEARQGDGTYVVAKERLQVEFFNAMDRANNKNVFEVRNMLENSIVLSAIDNATDDDIKAIEECLNLRNTIHESIRENTDADLKFHLAIAKATHNELMVDIYKYVSSYFNTYIYDKIYQNKQDQKYIDKVHGDLFEAIRDKNISLAKDSIDKIIKF